MLPAMNCPTCDAEFAGNAQGITFYKCGGKVSFGMQGPEYICGAKKVKITPHINTKKGTTIVCEGCDTKHNVEDNCCIKIQCPCGNQIKTCSS